MFREHEFFYTKLFLNPEQIDITWSLLHGDNDAARMSVDQEAISFDAISCLATWSLGSAGWDGENICLVFSVDFPTDLCSCPQEKGCV
jgi:hypothetical protein